MSIAVLNEVYTEARRLSIAGSVVAPGDFRLKKLVEPLKKAGAKAPVFAKVAECVEDVVNSTDKTSANSLLNLTSLVSSILFTQGTTGADGTLEPIKSSAVQAKRSQISARMLKPLIEALTTTGSGRFEQIKSAIELGLFADLRLVRPAFIAIDDSYGEIAELISEKVLPTYGKAILSDIKSTFDLKGKGGHARRLRLMHQIDPEFARDVVKESLTNGSAEVKVAAIECLGDSADDLSYLIEQTKAKAKDIRRAAYHALCKLKQPAALDVLVKAIDGTDLGVVASAVEGCQPSKLCEEALGRAKKLLVELEANKDKKKQGEQATRYLELLEIVGQDLTKESQKYLQSCVISADVLQKIKSTPSGQDIVEAIVATLSKGDQTSIKFLVDQREKLPVHCFADVFHSAVKSMKPQEFYKTFSPYLNRSAKKNSLEHQRHEIVWEGLIEETGFYWRWANTEPDVKLDAAWLNDAIKADDLELVTNLSFAKHPATIKYFTAKLADNKSFGKNVDLNDFAAALIKVEHPGATAYVLENVKTHCLKKSGYEVESWIDLAARLSAEALPVLEELAGNSKLSDRVSNRLVDAIAAIRERTASPKS